MKNILLCTLRASWAVIPEVYGFLSPDKLPLFQNDPKKDQLEALLREYQLQEPDEIWICTTGGEQTQKSLGKLKEWMSLLTGQVIVRIWQAADTNQLANQEECSKFRELILRACLAAHEYAGNGQVVLSLAGGRKTMSADMQWAGSLFGCQALIHVIGEEPLPEKIKQAKPELFIKPIPGKLCQAIVPLITGQSTSSDLLDINVDGRGPVKSENFPLPLPESGGISVWEVCDARLETELKKREKASSRLFGNYLMDISETEHHENWRSLYRLPPRVIEHLRHTALGERHRDWLNRLPKADLHRHLGGCLDLPAQRKVGRSIWQALSKAEQAKSLQNIQSLLKSSEWPWDWPERLKNSGNRAWNTAALLVHAGDEQLHHNLWRITEPRIAIKARNAHGFSAYERPGDLTGSAVLSHPASNEPYAQAIVHQAIDEGLAYVELRGSPQKYGDGIKFLLAFHDALQRELTSLPIKIKPLFRFIIITDRRHSREQMKQTLRMAVDAKERLPDFVVGLDMAGDEASARPEEIADLFLPAFEVCLPLTIHAGEGEPASSIWQAAYHLHADRIGHGLSINEHPLLAERFRDRAICLELCPTSNREVVGYYDPRLADTDGLPDYPLLGLWEKGLPLTICTDNPGISRTTLTDEYLAAAAMSRGQLTAWDALAVIKQGFVHGFMAGSDKEKLLKTVDIQLFQMMTEEFSAV